MRKNPRRGEAADAVLEAVRSRNIENLRAALATNDPEVSDPDGMTPLMEAVLTGQIEATTVLLAAGADPIRQDNAGWTALHFAAQDHQLECARVLLDSGARVDIRDSGGNTPLWRAVFTSAGRGEMIRLLLQGGADITAKNESGVSPAALAKSISNFDVCRFLE